LLLQFLHGKSDISKWWWAGTPSTEYPQMNQSSLPHSKDISLSDIDEVLRIGLDVRRLSSEIAEFYKPDPEIAILYSQTSIIQVPPHQVQSGSTPYIDALTSVWEGARFLGCRTGFVTESQIRAGKLAKIKLLIVPAVKYICPDVFTSVRHYIENGGTALIIPESFAFDQFARENNMLADFGITIKSVMLPPVTGEGERIQNYDQSFSQTTLYGEVREKITCINEDLFKGKTTPVKLLSDGLVQTIDPGNNKVLARFDDGKPALVLVRAGKGSLYYLASPLKTSDYHPLLSPLADQVGLNRPVVCIGTDGNLVTGAEVRAVERSNDYLVYASNLTSGIVEFDLKTGKKTGSMLDLRSMTEYGSSHIKLGPYQESVFRIEKMN
jgi:beta-galactosidase GanA